MSVSDVDHIYLETRDFDRSVSFWEAMGFSVAESWGEGDHRACRLVSGSTGVVLVNCAAGQSPQRATVHFRTEAPEALNEALAAADSAEVVTPLSDTHWNTRWIRVRDPDGNLYAIEAPTQA